MSEVTASTRRPWGLAGLLPAVLSGCSLMPLRGELPHHPIFSAAVFEPGPPIKCGKPEGCTPPVEVNRTLVLVPVPGEPPPKPYNLWCEVSADKTQPRALGRCVRVAWGTQLP
jgi:hypothetical protein